MEQNARRHPRTGFVTGPAAGIEVTLSLIFELLKITDLTFRHGAGRSAIYKLNSFKFFVKCAIATPFSGHPTSVLACRRDWRGTRSPSRSFSDTEEHRRDAYAPLRSSKTTLRTSTSSGSSVSKRCPNTRRDGHRSIGFQPVSGPNVASETALVHPLNSLRRFRPY
jgi:hypothetical protein